MNKFLICVSDYITNLSFKKLAILLLIISLFKTGVWYHPALWNMLEVAKDPFNNVFGNEVNKYYLYSSWLSPFIAYLLNLNTKISFFIFHLLLAIFFLVIFIFLIKKFVNEKYQKKSLIIFFIFPVSMTSFYWVGYDSLILILLTLSLLYYKNLFVIILCSLGIGLQHFEIGIVSTSVLLVCKILEKLFYNKDQNIKLSFTFIVIFFLGLILGKVILYEIYSSEDLAQGRLNWIYNALLHLIYNFYFNFYNIFWFSLGVGWILILKFFFETKYKYPFIISIFLILGILPIVDDHTRVYSACSFMLIVYYIICNNNFLKTIKNTELSFIFLIWIMLPYSWVWQGDLRSSMLNYDLAYVLNYFFDIFNNEIESSTIWPFARFN